MQHFHVKTGKRSPAERKLQSSPTWIMHSAQKPTRWRPIWSGGGLSVGDGDASQLGSHLSFDCFSDCNLIPPTHLNESSWIGFPAGGQDTKAASGRFSSRPVVLLWHSVKPLSLIIQAAASAKQICLVKDAFQERWWFPDSTWSLPMKVELLLIITLLAVVVLLCDLLCFSWLLLWMCSISQNTAHMRR